MLQGVRYVALLHTKPAEVKALSQLNKAARDNCFPIIVCRPGQHHDMIPTWAKLHAAMGNYRYGLDIDVSKKGACSNLPAKDQFDALFDPTSGFKNYYDRVEAHDGAIPVLRDEHGTLTHLAEQFDKIAGLDRGLIVRVRYGLTIGLDNFLEASPFDADDLLFAVDVGWSSNVLGMEAWATNTIRRIEERYGGVDVACISSSFPTSFNHIDARGTFSIDDRELFQRIRPRHNQANLVYGDWGSTRSAKEQNGGGIIPPRIDVPTTGDWTCFREFGDEAGYPAVAQRVVDDQKWASVPDCWGKHTVECSAAGVPVGISGTQVATAARVNVHLTVQALDGFSGTIEEEAYVDKF